MDAPLSDRIRINQNAAHTPGKNEDQLLWDAFRNGCSSSYALIYQQHFFSLYAYGLKICPEREIVKDCIQDLFVHLWKSRENLRSTNAIKFYLFTSLKRKLIDNYASSSRYALSDEVTGDSSFLAVLSEEQNLLNEQLAEEQKQRITQALSKLTTRQKEAVMLKFYDNLPNEDIADRMDISIEGVYNLVSKALSKFRQNLDKAYVLLVIFNYW
jgi:RNA polymerase sigma factor (sigma-70 family)